MQCMNHGLQRVTNTEVYGQRTLLLHGRLRPRRVRCQEEDGEKGQVYTIARHPRAVPRDCLLAAPSDQRHRPPCVDPVGALPTGETGGHRWAALPPQEWSCLPDARRAGCVRWELLLHRVRSDAVAEQALPGALPTIWVRNRR